MINTQSRKPIIYISYRFVIIGISFINKIPKTYQISINFKTGVEMVADWSSSIKYPLQSKYGHRRPDKIPSNRRPPSNSYSAMTADKHYERRYLTTNWRPLTYTRPAVHRHKRCIPKLTLSPAWTVLVPLNFKWHRVVQYLVQYHLRLGRRRSRIAE